MENKSQKNPEMVGFEVANPEKVMRKFRYEIYVDLKFRKNLKKILK
jgi:hypothetical protein